MRFFKQPHTRRDSPMSWEPFQEPGQPYTGPYVEDSAFAPATGPHAPPFPPPAPHWTPAAPLSLWDAIKQLPGQYWRVLTKPGTATFAAEAERARWDVIWAQVLGLSIFSALATMLLWLIVLALLNAPFSSFLAGPDAPNAGSSLGVLFQIPTPLIGLISLLGGIGGFFLGEGIAYLLAQAFGGQGDFKTQAYTSLLYRVPIGIGTLLLSLIPLAGSIGSLAGIYAYVLETFQQ